MLHFSKAAFVSALLLFFAGCFNYGNDPEPPFINEEQRALIKAFAAENGYPESSPIDNFVEYLYDEWPDDDEIIDFLLTFPKQDTIPRTLVLSDILTALGKTLRVYYNDRGYVYPAYIDSVEIRTDSVIILPSLDLEDCNLTHLPPEIGKIRTQSLDISENRMSQLPMEIMQLLAPPQYYPYTMINLNGLPNLKFDSLPDTLQDWFNNIYSKQDFQ